MIFECSLNVLRIFEYSLNFFEFGVESSSVLQILLEQFWQSFDAWRILSNELGSASIYSGLMKKSPLETSTLEETWSILIGQKSESLTRTY